MKKFFAELSSQIILEEGHIVEGILEESNEGDLISITSNDNYLGYLKINPSKESIIKSEILSNMMRDMHIDSIKFQISEIIINQENPLQRTYILEIISNEIIEGFFHLENNKKKRITSREYFKRIFWESKNGHRRIKGYYKLFNISTNR